MAPIAKKVKAGLDKALPRSYGKHHKPIVLTGFMGAGKSTLARELAAALGKESVDCDRVLEDEFGMSIVEVFASHGERAFREREEQVVLDLLKREKVLALGGGAVTSERVRAALKEATCVYVEISPELAWRRVVHNDRPLARDQERFNSLHAERAPLYESVARIILPSLEPGVARKAAPFIERMAATDLPGELKMVWASGQSYDYPVYFGSGALEATSKLWSYGRAFVVTDENVAEIYLRSVQEQLGDAIVGAHVLQPGEEQKTLSRAESVLRAMAKAGVGREDTVVALGGGVVGDLGGFCAATYKRGVNIAHIPTSLVAQVDSAYGGKTGVDLPEAKNYVGSFHQPVIVITDPRLLDTLPEAELAAGFAEVIKTALIEGGALWAQLKSGFSVGQLVFGCLRAKLDVVREDEFEQGGRAVLNLGHTVGHAIEAATAYGKYRHGEAVALGLLAALEISELKLGLEGSVRARVADVMAQKGLPLYLEGVDPNAVVERLAYDKKRRRGRSNWVLLRSPGEALIDQQVSDADARKVVTGLLKEKR